MAWRIQPQALGGVPQERLHRRLPDQRRGVAHQFSEGFEYRPLVEVGQSVDGGGANLGLGGALGQLEDHLRLAGSPVLAELQGRQRCHTNLGARVGEQFQGRRCVQVQRFTQRLDLRQQPAGKQVGGPVFASAQLRGQLPGLPHRGCSRVAQALTGEEHQRNHQQRCLGQVQEPVVASSATQQQPAQSDHVEHDDGRPGRIAARLARAQHQQTAQALRQRAQPESRGSCLHAPVG